MLSTEIVKYRDFHKNIRTLDKEKPPLRISDYICTLQYKKNLRVKQNIFVRF